MNFDNYECEGQMDITDFLQSKVVNRNVMDLTAWINSHGKAQYTQVGELLERGFEQQGIEASEEQLDRLTNTVSVWVLEQSLGYMEYLRGENQ